MILRNWNISSQRITFWRLVYPLSLFLLIVLFDSVMPLSFSSLLAKPREEEIITKQNQLLLVFFFFFFLIITSTIYFSYSSGILHSKSWFCGILSDVPQPNSRKGTVIFYVIPEQVDRYQKDDADLSVFISTYMSRPGLSS